MSILKISVICFALSTALFFSEETKAQEQSCKTCHAQEWQQWNGSHHAAAMQIATAKSVLGDFEDREITLHGVTTVFYRKGAEYWVKTENSKGALQDYKIEYTFGLTPLQQYLVKAEKGAYQVLPISWDSRDRSSGGGRWFHIYGNEHIKPADRLHWTGALQGWNGMCADCHSAGLKKNYDLDTGVFATTWKDINVSCRSCHGTGEIHSKTGILPKAIFRSDINDQNLKDYLLSLKVEAGASDEGWVFEEAQVTASFHGKKRNDDQLEVCAACHSIRTPLTDGFEAKNRYLDAFTPVLPQQPHYFSDGQIKEEVYVFGSFQQSKMFKAGVVCSDCHNPHSLKLKREGNALCTTCHLSEVFDAKSHHHHTEDTKPAQCVTCHMPDRIFMGVDARRDHSLRLPRKHDAGPNVCDDCHGAEKDIWTQAAQKGWYKNKAYENAHFGAKLQGAQVKDMMDDEDVPLNIKALSVSRVSHKDSAELKAYITKMLKHENGLIRLSAVQAAVMIAPNIRLALLKPMLRDEFRVVRIEAAKLLPADIVPEAIKAELQKSFEVTAWRGEGRLNIANYYYGQGDFKKTEEHYLKAIEYDSYFADPYIYLAGLYKQQGRITDEKQVFVKALERLPDEGSLNHQNALRLIRSGEKIQALDYLRRAVKYAPNVNDYHYILAVALKDAGQTGEALMVLRAAVKKMPADMRMTYFLVQSLMGEGQRNEAVKYLKALSALYPDSEQISLDLEHLQRILQNKP